MYLVDLHCDSLSRVSAERGLINSYNVSREYPQLQFVAEFVPAGDEPAEVRRRKLMNYLSVYISEVNRLNLLQIRDCHDVNYAVGTDRRATLLAVEGGGGLFADSEELKTLHRMGMRVLGPIWDTNELGCSVWEREDTGLTTEGEELVQRCSEMGIILDVSHMSDRSVLRTLEISPYPVLATHSNFREVCHSPRNLSLDLAKRIVSRGGVIGLNLYPSFLSEGASATDEDIFAHVDYCLDKLGDGALALGCDIDGTGDLYPEGFGEDSSMHDRLVDLLWRRYSEDTVERIVGLNAINFLKQNL